MTKGLVINCGIDSYELRYRATSEAFCKLLFFFCVLSKSLITCQQLRPIGSYQLKTTAVSLPPPPPPPLLIHRAVSIIHFVTLISCESFHVKLKSGISGLAPGTRFDLIYAEAVCC